VPLDRRSIERRDFPVRLRGYDRAAVDAHLRALADELESGAGTVASAAGEQVRAVLAAAEASAAQNVAEAEREARELREQASAATASARTLASQAQQERAARVAASSGAALERLDTLRGELAALLDALGTPRADGPQPPPSAPDRDRLVPDPDAPHQPATGSPPPDPDAPSPPSGASDDAGARLVALELALSGTAREDADHYLAEHFHVADRGALLDDVYAAAGA
jgi:DivIVA domain-containing protein